VVVGAWESCMRSGSAPSDVLYGDGVSLTAL